MCREHKKAPLAEMIAEPPEPGHPSRPIEVGQERSAEYQVEAPVDPDLREIERRVCAPGPERLDAEIDRVSIQVARGQGCLWKCRLQVTQHPAMPARQVQD